MLNEPVICEFGYIHFSASDVNTWLNCPFVDLDLYMILAEKISTSNEIRTKPLALTAGQHLKALFLAYTRRVAFIITSYKHTLPLFLTSKDSLI